MKGWKTWVGAIVAAASGIVRIGTAISTDPLDAQGVYEGILMIAGAFGIVGIGHKIEKTST